MRALEVSLLQGASSALVLEIQQLAEQIADEKLSRYTKNLARIGAIPESPKEINDAIWGTIKLYPLEVAILDSPLVQRLRFIRQLGVVHWVYPGAVHTRFEHTLGVLHQIQQLITAINEAAPVRDAPPISSADSSILRLCALLHDIGHGVFSHVSEHALIRQDKLRTALTAFARSEGLEKVQLSELVAYFMIGSPAFLQMLETLHNSTSNTINLAPSASENARQIAKKIQNAIVGRSISDSVPLLHELVSGPLDADKLDYFTRDSKLAGIPSVLDISRLTQKITVQVFDSGNLPPTVARQVSGSHPKYYLFGLKWSGAAVLDELHLARVLLYAKIYRHQKVLAAEAMVEALFEALNDGGNTPIIDLVRLAYLYSDDQLLWADPQGVLAAAKLNSASSSILPFVRDVLARLRNRDLYVNALSIRPSYPSDPWANDELQTKGLRALVIDLHNPVKAREFRQKLVSQILKLKEIMPSAFPEEYEKSLINSSIVISAKAKLAGGAEIDRAFIFHGSDAIQYRDLTVNRNAWADAYDFSIASAMVFCPREIAAPCYLAAELILRQNYQVILPGTAQALSKQRLDALSELKGNLESAGFYRGVPYDIRATPKRLTRADVSTFLHEMSQKFEAVDEPAQVEPSRRAETLRGRIESWLNQFRDSNHVDCAMEVLRKVRVIGRDDTKNALLSFVYKNPDFKGATIVLLGNLKDSSAMQGYYSRDVEREFPRLMTLEEVARKNVDAPIVFLDDFTGSGGQVEDMLGQGFDVEEMKKSLGEQRELFGELERSYLKSRKVGFVFVAGWDAGVTAVRDDCEKLGIDAVVYSHISETDIPFAFEGSLGKADAGVVESFRNKCAIIGQSILESNGVEPEKASQRALGYGNRAMLLVSRYNVPTQVLTCFWRSGIFEDVEWQPLLQRRQKN